MVMIKKGAKAATTTAAKPADNGTGAAIKRLKTAKSAANGTKKKFVLKDQNKTALGKVRFGCFNAALSSPAIAGMQFNTMEEYLILVGKAADAGVEYSFQD